MSEPLTGDTITDEEIEKLATEAASADDRLMITICDAALYEDDGDFRYNARARCAEVINMARALPDPPEAA